jgi:transposase
VIGRELEATILRLARVERWPVNTIAAQLGVHHDVVERVLAQGGLPTARAARPSRVDCYVPFIRETWERWPRLTASRLWRMCKERGYVGSQSHFRYAVSKLRPWRPVEAYLRLKTLPGEQAQVDWAHFGHVQIGRATRPLLAFVIVLSFSRAIFLRFFLAAKTEEFLRGHEEAFARWKGCARVLLYDNLKSAVIERIGDAIHFNSLLLDFAAHHGFEPRPVAPARGNEKGRVERAISFVRTGFFLARAWKDLDDLNAQADAWCAGEALERKWPEDPRRTVGEVFEEERKALLALPANPFPTDTREEVAVGKTPYVRFDRNDYSVPHTLVRRTLVVFASPTEVRILDGTQEVARHARSYDAGAQIEDPAHVKALVETKRRAREHRGIDRLAHAAPASRALLDRLAERGKNLGHSTFRLLRLLDAYGAVALEAAVREVLERDVPHVHAVAQVLERNRAATGAPPALPIPLPPGVRDLVVRPHALEGYDELAKREDDAGGEAPDEQDESASR